MAEEQSYGIVTTADGTPYKVPAGLTQQEAFDYVASIDPVRMGQSGHFSNLGDTYDFRTGVNNSDLRWRLSIASTMEEKAFILNDMAGEGNWGFTDWSNEPFVTPQGYENINNEPAPSDRLFLVDPAGATSFGTFGADLIDMAPAAAVFGGAVAGELLMPLAPGTGAAGGAVARGVIGNIIRRATGAASGDLAVNLGLNVAQSSWGIGDNRESFGEVAQRMGTEAGLIFGATLALGAPLAAMAPVAKAVQNRATAAGIGTQAPPQSTARATQLGRMTAAQQRVQASLGDDVLPVNIRALAGDPDTGELGFLAKQAGTLESAAVKAAGGDTVLAAKAANMLQKAKDLIIREKRTPKSVTRNDVLKNFSAKERAALKQLALAVEGKGNVAYKTKELAKLDKVDRTARALRTNVTTNLKAVHKARLAAFEPRFRAFKNDALGRPAIGEKRMSNLLNDISVGIADADIGITIGQAADKLINMLPNGAARLRLVGDKVVPNTRIPAGTAKFTAADLLAMDDTLRSLSFRNAGSGAKNFAEARRNIKASTLLHEGMRAKKLYNNKDWLKLSKDYSKEVTPFYGKGKSRGLFKVFDDSAGTNLEVMLKGIINGKESLELAKFLTYVDNVFKVPALKAAKEGIPTAQEIMGNMGDALVREKAVELGTLARLTTTNADDLRKAAKKIIKDLDALEISVSKKFGTAAAAKKVWHRLFRKGERGIVGNFRRDLAIVAGNDAAAGSRAAQRLATIPTRQEVTKMLDDLAQAADDPNKLRNIFNTYENLKKTPELKAGAEALRDMYSGEIFSRLVTLAGEGKTGYGLMKKWSDDFSSAIADPSTNDMLMELLGKRAHREYTDLALTLKGGLDFDPSAGSIVLGAMPMVIMGNLIQGNLKGMGKPALIMMTLKNFAPGTPLWKKLQAPLLAARSPQAAQTAIQTTTSKAGKAFNGALSLAQKASNGMAMGHSGYVAAGIHAFLDQNYYEASTKPQRQVTPPAPVQEEEEQMVAPPIAPAAAPPAAPVQVATQTPLISPAPVANIGQAGLNIGANIAQGRPRGGP